MSWIDNLEPILAPVRQRLLSLPEDTVAKGTVLFRHNICAVPAPLASEFLGMLG